MVINKPSLRLSNSIFVLVLLCIGVISLLSLQSNSQRLDQDCTHATMSLFPDTTNTVERTFEITVFLPSGYTRRSDEFTIGNWCNEGTTQVPLTHQIPDDQQPNTHTIKVTYRVQGAIVCMINTPFAVPYIATISSTATSPPYSKSYQGVLGLKTTFGIINTATTPMEYTTYIRNIQFMGDERLAKMVSFEFSPLAGTNTPIEIKLMKSDGTFITENHGCTFISGTSPIVTCTKAFEPYVDAIVIKFTCTSQTPFRDLKPILIDPTTGSPFSNEKLGCYFLAIYGAGAFLQSIEQIEQPRIPLPPTIISNNNNQHFNPIEYQSNFQVSFSPHLHVDEFRSYHQPIFQFVFTNCIALNNNIEVFTPNAFISPYPFSPRRGPSNPAIIAIYQCHFLQTPFFPNMNEYNDNDINRNARMFNRNNDSIVPWPVNAGSSDQLQNPHQLGNIASTLPTLNDVVTNANEKYFNVEVLPHHYGVVINNNDNDDIGTTSITNRITIAINGGFKPESTLTLKLSIPKTSTTTTIPSQQQLEDEQSIILSTTLSTAVQLRLESGYIRNTISTLTSIIPTIDSTTSNEYHFISWKCDISDYAHPEFVFDGIIFPTYTTASSSIDTDNVNNNNIQPNGDIYFAQLNEDHTINKSISPLSIPIEFEYYNHGSPKSGLYSFPPLPVTMKQHLSYQPIYAFIPNIQCAIIEFPILPPLPLVEDKIATVIYQLQSIPFNKPSIETLTTYDSNSFWKSSSTSSSSSSSSIITTKLYPNSIITIDYSQSTSTILYITNSFKFINYPKSTTQNDWSIITHNTATKTLSFTYIGTTIININEDDNDYNINEWFTFELQFDNENDQIVLTTSISMDSSTQLIPTILNIKTYDVEYIVSNYQGGKFTIHKIVDSEDNEQEQQHKLYLLSDKLDDDDTTTPSISSSFVTIAGTTQFNLTLSSPNQDVQGITTVKLMYYDLPSTTTNINSLSPLPIPIEVYSFTQYSFESISPNQSITHIITIPTTITSTISNSKFVFFQIIFTPNDITQVDPLTSIVNSQTFEILSSCFSLPTNNNDNNNPLQYINTCGVNGTCLRNGQCECYNNYSGDNCTIRSKCIGYCINGNYDSCDESININSTTSPCKCKQGWSGLQCDQNNNDDDNNDDDTTPQSQRKPNSTILTQVSILFNVIWISAMLVYYY